MFQRIRHMLLVCLLTSILVAEVVNAQELVTDGLLAFYSFDKNTIKGDELQDLFGENHGKIMGKPKSVTGKINGALEFNGTSDCVELPDMGNKEAVSMEVWLYATDSGGSIRGLVSSFPADQWKPGTVHFKKYGPKPGMILRAHKNDGDAIDFNTEGDQWHHAAYTSDTKSGELKLYVDGEEVGKGAAGKTSNNLTHLRIASEHDGRYFQGVLDEVRIYERILSDAEVKKNFTVKSNRLAVDFKDKLATTWGSIKAQ